MAAAISNPPISKPPEAKPRRRFQFSLRTALLLMLFASILFAGFAWRRNRAERQRKVVEELRELGANVDYKYWYLFENDPAPSDEFFLPALLRRFLGDDFVYDIRSVNYLKSVYVNPPPASAEDRRRVIELVKKLPKLDWVSLNADVTSGDLDEFPFLETVKFLNIAPPQGGSLTDIHLVFLEKCGELESLLLYDQAIDGSGLIHLHRCKNLRTLLLCRTPFGDESLIHLSVLTKLESLNLSKTSVTDAGIAKAELPQGLQAIDLDNTAIGDAALENIAQLPNLVGISIQNTKVTKQGVQRFKDQRPGCLVFD
jgi:hypothetical protein